VGFSDRSSRSEAVSASGGRTSSNSSPSPSIASGSSSRASELMCSANAAQPHCQVSQRINDVGHRLNGARFA
jgi:hypothetical protein